MTKFKFNFHLKSASVSSTGSFLKNADTSHETRIHRSFKDYITGIKAGRFLTVRRRSQTVVNVGASSPVSFGRKTPRTPLASLFAPRPTQSESIPHRRHRRYTVSLTQFPQHRDVRPVTDVGLGLSLEPDFASDISQWKSTTNSHMSTIPSIPDQPSAPNLLSTQKTKRREPFDLPNLVDSSVTQACSLAPSLPAYPTRSQEVEEKRQPESLALKGKTDFHRVAEILQQATRRIQADGAFSQAETFRFLAPLVVFTCILGMAVILPKYSAVEKLFGMGLATGIAFAVLGGVGSALIVLRASIWVIGVLAQSFCEIELENLFQKTELVDANGRRMGEAEMVVGLFG